MGVRTRLGEARTLRPRTGSRVAGSGLRRFFHLLALLVVLAGILFPFYWMVSTSLKTTAQTFAFPPVWVFAPTLEHYREALLNYGVGGSLLNSLIVSVTTTLLAIALGAPAAYAIARFDFPGKKELWFWFITNRMVSPIVLALPFFLLARNLHLIDTYWVLILVYLTFTLPIVVWICTDQFRTIPKELDEAALVDGASLPYTFLRIALPLAAPGVVVSGILSFIFSWNELLYPLVLTRSEVRTAPVAATSFMSGYELPWGEIMATGTLIVLPVIVFAMLVSRQLVRGLTMGAVK
ncbi:carbohydrate ABC transporter permease [soil metagenome]